MKLVIASDIHGSAYYCDLLINKIKEEKNYKSMKQGIEVKYNKLTYCIEK